MSASQVSRVVAELELRWGPLLVRSTRRRIELTAAGRKLVEPARELVWNADRLAGFGMHLWAAASRHVEAGTSTSPGNPQH